MIRQSLQIGVIIFVLICALFPAKSPAGDLVAPGWERSFQAGYTDPAGHYVGGATIMHLVAHKGLLFAADAYWCDSRNIWYGGTDRTTGWAQILRLDKPGGKWVVDLELGPQFLRPEILKSVAFTTDAAGKPLAQAVNLLLAAAFSPRPGNVDVALFTRDDVTGNWARSTVYTGPKAKEQGEFSVRAMCVYRDKVTGVDRLFLSIGKLGIFSGVYDPASPGQVKWSDVSESGSVETRPLAITQANGDLVFSSGRKIYRRIDGDNPSYQVIADLSDIYPNEIASPTGGARGLTAIANPAGKGQSLLFAMWTATGRGPIFRLDPEPDGSYHRTREVALADLVSQYLPGVTVRGIGPAYNEFHAVTDPITGKTVHLVSLEARITAGKYPTWGTDGVAGGGAAGFYAGSMIAIRDSAGKYRLTEVNGPASAGKPPLVATYCMADSPFPQDHGHVIYFGGLDANNHPAHNLAWIFDTRLDDFLRAAAPGQPAEERR
jgi:hypothetical protein